MQQLVVRLGSQFDSPVQWLRYDNSENEVIASGELSSASQLASLQEHGENAEVIALAPSADVLLSELQLPKKQSRKILGAIQYMLEDKLCFDVDSQFVAKGQMSDDKLQVAVVDKGKLRFWQELLADAGLFCQRLIPDCLLLPTPDEDKISLLQIKDDLLCKMDKHHAIQGESSWVLSAVLEKAKDEELDIICYSELHADELPENIAYNYDRLPLDLLRHELSNDSLNLFQGEFEVKAKSNPTWQKWKVAAALAIVALTVNIAMKTVELNQVKSQRAELNQQITQTVANAFPNIQRIRKSILKRTISQELARLENTGGGASMLAMLSQMSPAFASTGVTPQTLSFNSARTEIRMQSVAKNFESLERFRRDVTALGLEVEQGAINNRGDEVVGVIVIRG